MPLRFPGQTTETESRVSIRATDFAGKQVVVAASHEAIQDYGMSRVQEVASDKFDSGKFETDSSIFVRTADFS